MTRAEALRHSSPPLRLLLLGLAADVVVSGVVLAWNVASIWRHREDFAFTSDS